ncbi:MAG: hypothetical protein LRY76_00600 [Alphaproteobacteria bacterium]|nr:hypothetical protein [Alphaproteobacteria bacterium]MCD8570037.1 hypothetical protein [Alphaproteobacteria bacterium]
MEVDFTAMTPEQIEELKPFLYIVAIIPAILIVRFFFFLLTPKFILKRFFSGKQGYKRKDALRKKKRPFDD